MYEIRKHKTEIREYYIEKRRAIEDGIKAEKDAKVSSNVIASATYRYADTLLLYMPKADEIDISGGYYDRYLSSFKGTKVGVAYTDFIANSVPHGRFDLAVDVLITERGIYAKK